MSKLLKFKLKGTRLYVHGTDIYNAVFNYLININSDMTQLEISFHGVTSTHLELTQELPIDRKRIKCIAHYLDAKGIKNSWYVLETLEPVSQSYQYDESLITEASIINHDNESVTISTIKHYTFIENVVALNKHLLLHLFADEQGKWLFTKLQLNKPYLESAEIHHQELKLELKANFNFRLTKTELFLGGQSAGYIYFSLLK